METNSSANITVALNDRECLAIFSIISQTIWGGGEETMLAQVEIIDTLGLERFHEHEGKDVAADTLPSVEVPYSLSPPAIKYLRMCCCGMGQRYALGRHNARALKKIIAAEKAQAPTESSDAG